MHDRVELLLSGYFKEMEGILNQNIPNEISEIIVGYHKLKDTAFAIGGNQFMKSPSYVSLPQIPELQPSTNNIYRNHQILMIITPDNQLYGMGANGVNSGDRLGIDSKEYKAQQNGDDNIHKLVKIKDNVKLASEGCENSNHSFVYTVDNKLYGSGYNYSGHFLHIFIFNTL